ncbi:fibroblast growth factor 21 [Poeciliopsis prolifica]|uniref:fibroblast growth factor 21 n=1 Tax=Poeciliopsis prolifica TaxID=188132 RepID=UPI00241459CD|nr:fibroblast growth factor 21 [Poeciliopsis prolifica]
MFLFPNNHPAFPFPFLFFILSLPFSWSFYIPESNPIFAFRNQLREVNLYTENHRQGLYVEIHLDGRVTGSDALSPYSVLQIKSVKPGHVVIKGQTSSLFLCMDDAGNLRGQKAFYEADCSFRELLLADGYTRFLNSQHGIPLSLASRNSPDRHSVPFTRFLPLRNTLTVSEESTKTQRDFNLDSDDLLGMGQNAVVSPQLLMD